MEKNMFSGESEHLFLKFLAAKEQLDVEKDPDTIKCIKEIMKKIVADILETDDRLYKDKILSMVILDNDEDTKIVKKGVSGIVMCVFILIISLVITCLAVIVMGKMAKANEAARIALVEQEFVKDFDEQMEKVKTSYYVEDYHISKITYSISNIKWYDRKKGLVYVDINAEYDAEKYDTQWDNGADRISFVFEDLCWYYKFKASNGWTFQVMEKSLVNGKRAKYSDGNDLPFGYEDATLYTESNFSWIVILIEIVLGVVMIIVIRKKQNVVNEARYNLSTKIRLK